MKKLKKVVDPAYAKSKEYSRVINAIAKEGMCPFCQENFKYHKKPILKKHVDWFITESTWPYKNTRHHFLVMTMKHKEKFSELSVKDWESIRWLIRWIIKEYKIKGGGLAMRFGETSHTGATVCHLHMHLFVPELKKNGRAKVVNFPIG